MLAVCQPFRIAWRQCLLCSLCPAFCIRFLHIFKEHAFFLGFPALPSHYIDIVWIFFLVGGRVVCNIRPLFRSWKQRVCVHVWVRQEIPTYMTKTFSSHGQEAVSSEVIGTDTARLPNVWVDQTCVCESVDYVSFKTFMWKPKLMLIKVIMMCISTPFSDSTAC